MNQRGSISDIMTGPKSGAGSPSEDTSSDIGPDSWGQVTDPYPLNASQVR